MNNDLFVEGNFPNDSLKTKLTPKCVQRSSFYLQWEQNSSYQIQFTAQNDYSTGYDLLQPSATLWFQGQEFLINSVELSYSAGVNTKAVVATHIYSECKWIRTHYVKNGVLTYTPQDIMNFVFANNAYGFTWEIIGNFAGHEIENLGNMSGQDALSKIVEVWPDAIIYPDNRNIKIYQHDSFIKHLGHRLGYQYNSTEIQIQYDNTSVTNKVWCIGKEKDKPDNAPDNAPTEYYFDPFWVTDDDSIKNWTHGKPREMGPISDERFTDASSMKQYALSQLTPTPPLACTVNSNLPDQPIPGDLMRLEIKDDGLATDVEVVRLQWYPWDKSATNQYTLNNTFKTIFDYNNSIRNKTYKDMFSKTNALLSKHADDINKINGQIVDEHNPAHKSFITLGDSIAQGYDPDELNLKHVDWPYKVAGQLETATYRNVAIGGSGFYYPADPNLDSANQWKNNDFSKFDYATIAFGTNDFVRSVTETNITNTINNMVYKMKNDNPNLKIFGILPTPRYDYPINNGEQSNGHYSFTNLLDYISRAFRSLNVPVLDWRNYNPVIFSDSNHSGLCSDKIHPNNKGYTEMANQIVEFLQVNY